MEKHWRGKGKGATLEAFWSKVLSFPRREDTPPVIKHGRHILVSILRGGLFFLAVTTGEMPSLLVVELLHRIVDVFEEYFGSASVSALTKAFSVAYQLLDEMVDHGYPLITEPNALQSLISKPSLGRRLSSFVTGSSGVKDSIDKGALSVIPWRKTGVSYINNELLMDIVEEVDAILAANGSVVKADIRGTFSVNCKLTGMPDVTLHTTAPAACADASLHPCVRIARFARDKVLSFVPPDGNFVLLRYRAPDAKLTVPVYCTPTLTWRDGVARTSFVIGTKHMSQAAGSARSSTMGSSGISSASFGFGAASSGAGVRATGGIAGGGTSSSVPVEEVVLTITFPKNYVGVDLSSEVGSITFEESTNVSGRARVSNTPCTAHTPSSPATLPRRPLCGPLAPWTVTAQPR